MPSNFNLFPEQVTNCNQLSYFGVDKGMTQVLLLNVAHELVQYSNNEANRARSYLTLPDIFTGNYRVVYM